MKPSLKYDKNFGKWFLNDVIKAIKKYRLIENNEKIAVALSGGKDSATLLYILRYLSRFSFLRCYLYAIHIKIADYNTEPLKEFCENLDVPYFEKSINQDEASGVKVDCFICSRLKRGAIVSTLVENQINKVAYGHHAEDVAETLFMNIILNKKLGSFSPKVSLEESSVSIIRPMVYLEEAVIRKLHAHLELPSLPWRCEHADNNQRTRFKRGLSQMNQIFGAAEFARKVVESLENIDNTNIWADLISKSK